MPSEITDNAGASRYEIRVAGELAGFAEYRLGDGEIAFTHTEIDDRFGGEGHGSELIAYALDDVASRKLAVLPFCSFVEAYIAEHSQLAGLVPADRRAEFAQGGNSGD